MVFKFILEESWYVDLLFYVIDVSDFNYEEYEKVVMEIFKDLDMIDIFCLVIYNKMDVIE